MKVREATRFVDLLGKDRAATWLRFIHPQRRGAGGGDHQGLTSRESMLIERCQAAGFNVYAVIGNADIASGKGGGVTDADITAVPALFVEWDDGASIERQTARPAALGLPDPTVMVSTGGKSVHAYWVLHAPMAPDEWRPLQRRLIAHCNGDKACSNPARVMRLPGSAYISKTTGEPTGECQIINDTGSRYSAAEIAACLPAPEAPPAPPRRPAAPPGRQPRGLDEISAAAACIPMRVGGMGTYEADRNALCGCSAALAEAGVADPDAAALALLGHLWPSERDAAQVLESTTTRSAASFWSIAREHGHQLQRQPPAQPAAKADGGKQNVDSVKSWMQLLGELLQAVISSDDDAAMVLRAEAIMRFRRTDAQIDAALFKLHTSEELQREDTMAPESLDLSKISGMDWLVEGFIPDNDLTLLYGAAGTGKTTAALALACAVLRGTGFLDHEHPARQTGVLFIASDSGATPLYAAMQDMSMADMPEVNEGPEKRFHVWAADPDQGMTAWGADLRGCIQLLHFIQRHQIGLVLIDSCKAACSRAGLDYMNNQLVTELLTHFKEVICPHAAVVWLTHDGVAREAHAGAKAWKEIPSMVHMLKPVDDPNGKPSNSQRWWGVMKSRMGPTRQFNYAMQDGQLTPVKGMEVLGNCLARVVDVLVGALQLQGVEALSRTELQQRICMAGGPSRKTLDNTLTTACRAKHPEICRVSGRRGHYKLAPRIADPLKGCMLIGKEQGQKPVPDCDLSSSRQVPMGTSNHESEFPREKDGNLTNASGGNGSDLVPSQCACTPIEAWHTRAAELYADGKHYNTIALLLEQEMGVRVDGRQVKEALR